MYEQFQTTKLTKSKHLENVKINHILVCTIYYSLYRSTCVFSAFNYFNNKDDMDNICYEKGLRCMLL